MKYLLDTNVIVGYLNGRVPDLRARLDKIPNDDVRICSVVKAELLFGAEKSQRSAQVRAEQTKLTDRYLSLPFDDDAAYQYAAIRADLERKGTPIGPLDLMIASIALANDLTLITHNTAEFGRISGLQTADWETQ
jgi:tRNA(fMet)-specific endonuclease VapC